MLGFREGVWSGQGCASDSLRMEPTRGCCPAPVSLVSKEKKLEGDLWPQSHMSVLGLCLRNPGRVG